MCLADTKEPDAQLVVRSGQGDTAAYARLVERYAALAFATARCRVRDQPTASDVVQAAFMTALERLPLLREPDRFAPWLRKLVVVECARLAREEQRAARGSSQLSHMVDRVDETTTQEENDGELGRAAVRLLGTLPPAQREAAELCLVRGVSRADAAAFLGVSDTTLRKRLHDARRKLQAKVFQLARETLREDQLPPGFAQRCVCNCERSRRNSK